MKAINYILRLFRVADWWNFLVPPIFAFCYLAILLDKQNLQETYTILLLLFASVTGTACFGFFLNDVSDIAPDRAAGRISGASELKPRVNFIILFLALGVSFVPWFFITYNSYIFSLYILQLLLLITYSLPPLRLKRYAIPALFADALYSSVLFPFIALSLISEPGQGSEYRYKLWGIVFLMLLVKGLRNIIRHQLNDEILDRLAHQRTFVTKYGKALAERLISYVFIPAEWAFILGFVMLLTLCYNLWFALLIPVFILYSLLIFLFEKNTSFFSAKTLNSFTTDALPLFLLAMLAQQDVYFYIVLVLHFLLFRKTPAFLLFRKVFDLVIAHYLFHGFIMWVYYKGFCNKYALRFYSWLGLRKDKR